jgi:hypothetical protein
MRTVIAALRYGRPRWLAWMNLMLLAVLVFGTVIAAGLGAAAVYSVVTAPERATTVEVTTVTSAADPSAACQQRLAAYLMMPDTDSITVTAYEPAGERSFVTTATGYVHQGTFAQKSWVCKVQGAGDIVYLSTTSTSTNYTTVIVGRQS